MVVQIEFVEGTDFLHQPAEAVDLLRKLFRHLLLQQAELVGKAEAFSGKTDFGDPLLTQAEILVRDAQLLEQLAQGRRTHAARAEVGHGVQADVERAVLARVEGVEPADLDVLLDEQGLAVEHRQANAGGQTGESRANNQGIVLHGLILKEESNGGNHRLGR